MKSLFVLLQATVCAFMLKDKNVSLLKEKIVIDHGLELYKHLQAQESDCYKRVTIDLFEGCQSLSVNSTRHIEYAIQLTMCELSMAQVKIPGECQSLNRGTAKQCVKKLSHSPQTWTSYSVMICFAIRYPLEKDTLEKLHANITLNQAKNFDMLSKQQERLIQWQQEEFKTLGQLKDTQQDLLDQLDHAHQIHLKSANQIQSIFDALVVLQHQTEAVMERYNQLTEHHVQQMTHRLDELTLKQETELYRLLSSVVSTLQTVDHQLTEMLLSQQHIMQQFNTAEQLQTHYLQRWQQSMEAVNLSLSDILITSLNHVRNLNENLGVIQDQVSVLSIPFYWLKRLSSTAWQDIQCISLTITLHGVLFSHLYRRIRGHGLKRIAFALLLTLGHIYALHAWIFAYPTMDTNYVKSFILLFEWILTKLHYPKSLTRNKAPEEHIQAKYHFQSYYAPAYLQREQEERDQEAPVYEPTMKKYHFHCYY
ncbi:uncharacterized protein B0P05DRAFT_512051 [Gilbertella persicaria]|uniref:uncharacterized protein n=1 Tax=Gilbertella persicaria TaxID=101096 RepID=UPI002220B24D|nr:uncharacterized protein B0P05DRAFT_512051 [Gilbertella persicaria]KAI8076535.1 hypothetical protein B0P05DRAFT_512051 [Gilbertella persicaria]